MLAWIWLDVARVAQGRAGTADSTEPAEISDGDVLARGKLAAARYFFRYELPKVPAWLGGVETRDATCREMSVAFF